MGTGCLELAHAAHWSSFENSCPQRAPVIAALCRRLPWTCAGSWVLRELDAMEGKRSLDNLSFQKKATLSLSTYMVCTIFLQMHTTVHSLSEHRSLSNKWDSASASDASADLPIPGCAWSLHSGTDLHVTAVEPLLSIFNQLQWNFPWLWCPLFCDSTVPLMPAQMIYEIY